MNNTWSKLTLIVGLSEIEGKWKLDGEILVWNLEDREYRITDEDLSVGVTKFLKILSKRIYKQKCQIKACLNCKRFVMSGMARDMGRGQRGTCNFYNKSVEICYLCENYL